MEETQRLSTVAELRAMPDEELIERHDALVASGEPLSDVYLGELGRRLEELELERTLKLALAGFLFSSLAVAIAVAAFVLAL